MNYWAQKGELAAKAKQHTDEMGKLYQKDIEAAIRASRIFDGQKDVIDEYPEELLIEQPPKITFVKKTTVDALMDIPPAHPVCVLNFASYKEPGGRFMQGSSAQEESLCHASYLYNVLSHFTAYYEWNNQHKNNGLYRDRAIYIPDVLFIQGRRMRRADVLTCAAPNRSLIRYGRFTEEENQWAMKIRIGFIIDLLSQVRLTSADYPRKIILGAWGCGVFKQNPKFVARTFKEVISRRFLNWTNEIIFAIPDKTIDTFKEVFSEK